MLAHLQVIGGDQVPHPLGPVLLLSLHGIGRVGHRTLCYGIGEDTLLFLGIVKTEGSLDIEVLDRVDVHIDITEGTPVGITVVAVTIQSCYRILTVGIATYRTGIFAIGSIDRERGVELQHVL